MMGLQHALALKPIMIDGRDHPHPPRKCGGCGGVWTWSAGEQGKPDPAPGAFCICSFCAAICQYRADMSGVVLSKKELRALPRAFRRDLFRLQAALQASIATRKARLS